MRRNREPGTRNPLSCPLSKQRIMVCWLTLQILAASPVVKTVFMRSSIPCRPRAGRTSEVSRTSLRKTPQTEIIPDLPLIHPSNVAGVAGPCPTAASKPQWLDSVRSDSESCKDKEEGLTKLSNNSDYNQPAERVNAN